MNILYRRTQTARTKLIRTIKKKKKDKGNDLMDKDMRKRIRTRRDTDEYKIEKDRLQEHEKCCKDEEQDEPVRVHLT